MKHKHKTLFCFVVVLFSKTKTSHGCSEPESVLPPQSETRSTKYWKEDGDVVLRVESTLFKLKGQHLASTCLFLSRHLRDLLDLKTVPAGTEVVENCPAQFIMSYRRRSRESPTRTKMMRTIW